MANVLIFQPISDLKPTGWPNWYLYNLNNWFKKNHSNIKISFLPPLIENKDKKKKYQIILDKLKKYEIMKKIINYLYVYKYIFFWGKPNYIDFNKYDIIHFHSTRNLYLYRNYLKNYKWKIIVTSHSPKPYYQEFIDTLMIKPDIFIKKKLEYREIYAFNRADYILFPCKESEECYYNQRNKYSKIHEDNKNKYIYLETWLIPIELKDTQTKLREKYKLKKDDYVICYVWRHNEVKWYDSLKKLWDIYLKRNHKSKFLIAGKEEPLKWLKNDRRIETWWTDKPYEIIKSWDIFVLPNKETYFDLILLEVLSLWKPIVLTKTWWNKYFEKFFDSWIFFYDYDNQDEFNSILDRLQHENLDRLWKKNKKIFDENFTSEIFAKKYIELYNSLLK